MTPDQQVDAVAKAIYESEPIRQRGTDDSVSYVPWDKVGEIVQELCRRNARSAIRVMQESRP